MDQPPALPILPPDLSVQITAALDHARSTPVAEWQTDPTFGELLADLFRRINEALRPLVQFFQRVAKQITEALRFLLAPPNSPVRRHKRPRNTRVRMVQAKRKRLDLSPDGKCCGLRSRKASYAFRLEEQRYYAGLRADLPNPRDFGHIPARRRKKEARRQLKWKPISMGERERDFIDYFQQSAEWLARRFDIPEPLPGPLLATGGVIDQRSASMAGFHSDSGPELVWPAPGSQIFPRQLSQQEREREMHGKWIED